MPDVQIDLEELIRLVRDGWPHKYARGRLMHVHRNAIRLSSGALVHLRVLVQQIAEPDQLLITSEVITDDLDL